MPTEPTSGNEPITEMDQTAVEADEKQRSAEEKIAEEHKYTGPQLTPEEYDAQGKGEDYEPHVTGPTSNPLGQAQPGEAVDADGNETGGPSANRTRQSGSERSQQARDEAEAKQTQKRLEQGKQSTSKG
jgi:hypothetical protein